MKTTDIIFSDLQPRSEAVLRSVLPSAEETPSSAAAVLLLRLPVLRLFFYLSSDSFCSRVCQLQQTSCLLLSYHTHTHTSICRKVLKQLLDTFHCLKHGRCKDLSDSLIKRTNVHLKKNFFF